MTLKDCLFNVFTVGDRLGGEVLGIAAVVHSIKAHLVSVETFKVSKNEFFLSNFEIIDAFLFPPPRGRERREG